VTLTLILTRHAKSDWDNPLLDDHDRPLNNRGRRDAPRIGAWLKKNGHVPDKVTVSSARRAQETWEGIATTLGGAPKVSTAEKLYHASPETLLAYTRGSYAMTHMIIGHNPGIAEFAGRLLARAPQHPRFADFPTCATLVVDCEDSDWRDVQWGMGRVLDFVTPHDLP
jgi:phosphohistidine phosphatase